MTSVWRLTFRSPCSWPEVTKRPSDTDKRTKQEHEARPARGTKGFQRLPVRWVIGDAEMDLLRLTLDKLSISGHWWTRFERWHYGGEDIFVHILALERSGLSGLSEGDRVIFNIAEGRKKGWRDCQEFRARRAVETAIRPWPL